MPQVHDSAEKRQFFSSVEVFDVNTGCWEQRTTRGTPPLGVWGYSCVRQLLSGKSWTPASGRVRQQQLYMSSSRCV